MKDLKIAEGFALPIDLVTSTQAILARKRSGKSYTASVEAEEMLEHGQQIAVIDPTSAWYGLRSSADGKGPGYAVVVFGGEHADAPLEPRGGKAMARALVEHGFSAIFDVGNWITEDQIQFVLDFSSELLRINRDALHLFIDEADTFAPQLLEGKDQKKCLGAVSRLVKQGGIKGIGVTMITQRGADLNKKLISQIDRLTVLRMSHPPDIEPAAKWISANIGPAYAAEVAEALPRLEVGEAFVCAEGGGKRVRIRLRRTFNSGATPKPGEKRAEPKVLAPIDIQKLGTQIAESVREQQANEPEELKKKIAELERKLAAGEGNKEKERMLGQQIQQMEEDLHNAREDAGQAAGERDRLKARMNEVAGHIRVIAAIVLAYEDEDSAPPPLPRVAVHPPAAARIPEVRALAHAAVQYVQNVPNGTDGTSAQPIKAGARRMLGVLCQWHPKALSEAQVAVQSEMKRSGTFDSYKSALRTAGLIEIQDGKWKATRAGLDFLGARFGPPPRTTAEVFAVWAPKLKLGARRMLEVLIRSPHVLIPRAELAKSVGMAESGTFDSYLSALRTADLIITEKGHVAANREVLFL